MSKKDIKDPVDDILDELNDDDDDGDDFDTKSEDVKALEAKIEELEKKNMGLLNETKAQRRKRQATEDRLNKLTDTVEGVLSNRQPAADGNPPAGASTPDKITLDYDDDGNPVLDTSTLLGMNKALEEKISNLEYLLQATAQQQDTSAEAQRVVQAIVGEDERYGPAFNKYQNARKWVEDKVVEFQDENKLTGVMSSGQALDHVFGKDLEDEFKSMFPGMDLERVVTAEDSQRHFRNTLAMIADASFSDNKDKGNRIKKVLEKPSSLGANANQKGANLSLEERLANISPTEVVGLSDAQAAQLEKALGRLEE